MKIGLLSDVHASPDPVREAIDLFAKQQIDTILCAGDIAGYGDRLDETVELLQGCGCRSIFGNHDLWHLERYDYEEDGFATNYLRSLPASIEMETTSGLLTMVHASPSGDLLDGIRLLNEKSALSDKQKTYWAKVLKDEPSDILVVGHTHQVFAQQLGHLLLINPGSTLFNHTCAILTLPERTVDFFPLSGKNPVLSWNFSMFREMQL